MSPSLVPYQLILVLAVASAVPDRSVPCGNPTFPSAEENPTAFIALHASEVSIDEIYPLCGKPRRVVSRSRVPTREITFDELGNIQTVISRVTGDKTVFLYGDAGWLAEVLQFSRAGELKRRDVMEWDGPFRMSVFMVLKDGTRSLPAMRTYVLDIEQRTLDVGGFHKEFDDTWALVHSSTEGMKWDSKRDEKGRLLRTLLTDETYHDFPLSRIIYSDPDSRGNPSKFVEEQGASKFGTTYFIPYGTTWRSIEYW